MAKIYANQNGEILRVLASDSDEIEFGAPVDYATMVEFDPDSNPTVLPGIARDYNGHRLTLGVLYYNGIAVTIYADSDALAEYKQLSTYRAQAKTYLALSNPTAAQTAAAVKVIIRVIGILLDYVLKRKGIV